MNSMISVFASSIPATSLKVTPVFFTISMLFGSRPMALLIIPFMPPFLPIGRNMLATRRNIASEISIDIVSLPSAAVR